LVEKFFAMYPLQGAEKAFFISRRGDKKLYNIVYGVFENRFSVMKKLAKAYLANFFWPEFYCRARIFWLNSNGNF